MRWAVTLGGHAGRSRWAVTLGGHAFNDNTAAEPEGAAPKLSKATRRQETINLVRTTSYQ